MSVFDRVAMPRTGASVAWGPLDDRWYGEVGGLASTFTGLGLTPETALRVSAVFACNSLIAETLGSLPCHVMKKLDAGGEEKAKEHRVYRTLRRVVNAERRLTPIEFFSGSQMTLGMRGRTVARIEDTGDSVSLYPLDMRYVKVEETPSGRLRYVYNPPMNSKPTVYLQDEVLDVRDLTTDGFAVRARAALAREAIAVAAAAEMFVGSFFKNDATGRLVIKHPGNLSPQKRAEFRSMVQENYAGAANASKAMLLTHGVDVTELGKEDSGKFLVDPRNFQAQDVARYWRVPSFLIGLPGPTAWGGGLEEQLHAFATFTMKAWTDRWAQALLLALFDEDEWETFEVKFEFNDLVRAKLLERMQAYQIGKQIGMWNSNELRAKEGTGPREGGDEYQETPAGAAPNEPGAERTLPGQRKQLPAPAKDEDEEDDNEDETSALFAARMLPLVRDAAQRIVAAEARECGQRLAKRNHGPEQMAKYEAWARQFYATTHAGYVERVLTPLAQALQLSDDDRAPLFGEIADIGLMRALLKPETVGLDEHAVAVCDAITSHLTAGV